MQKNIHITYMRCLREILLTIFQDNKTRWSFIFSSFILVMGVISNLSIPFLMKKIIENISSNNLAILSFIMLSYGLIWTLHQISVSISGQFIYKIERHIVFHLEKKVISHLFSLSQTFFLNKKPGAIANILKKSQESVSVIISGVFLSILPVLLEFSLAIMLVSTLYPIVYGFLMFVILGTFFIYTAISIKKMMKLRELANKVDRNTDGVIFDWILNHEGIKVFGKQNLAIASCEVELKKREVAEFRFTKNYHFTRFGQSVILGIGLTVLTFLTAKDVVKGVLTIGDFVLFNGYILQLILPINILGQIVQHTKKAIIDMKDVLKLLSTKSEITEIINPVVLDTKHFYIDFKNVSFKYDEKVILYNKTFKIEPGETVLILGKTGSGKSTIAKLLLRFFDPDQGEILINNVDIKKISLGFLSEIVSWVPQETYLLNDTILNNLLFVCPDATMYEIEKALEYACIIDFIKSLPLGLNTRVGNRGLKLSGGEKQRLSLARLFLKKPKIAIFDESTSALDKQTALVVQNNIKSYFPSMTKIIITHHPSHTPGSIDKIINLDSVPTYEPIEH